MRWNELPTEAPHRVTVPVGILLALSVAWPAFSSPVAGGSSSRLTELWEDVPADPTRVRIDPVPGITEPSDLLMRDGRLYTISDNLGRIYRLDFDSESGDLKRGPDWQPALMPETLDLEALAQTGEGAVLAANETTGSVLVLSPFPTRACAAWESGIAGDCFMGHANCGIEAMAVIPGRRVFIAKERQPRRAYIFDLPRETCKADRLSGRTYLRLPREVGPDISAATYDAASEHLLIVARSRQSVLEFAVPEPTPSDTSPRDLELLGVFRYAATEDTLEYVGAGFKQVEGIAVGADRVLYLIVDNNENRSRRFGTREGALLRFYPRK